MQYFYTRFSTLLSNLRTALSLCGRIGHSLSVHSLRAIILLGTLAFSCAAWGEVYYIGCFGNVSEKGELTKASSYSNLSLTSIKYSNNTYAKTTEITYNFLSDKNGKFAGSTLTDVSEISKWSSGSGSCYAGGIKLAKSSAYSITLQNSEIISKVTFIGYPNGKNGTIKIASTENTLAAKQFYKFEISNISNSKVSIEIGSAQDLYGVFVIETQTPSSCTAPVITTQLVSTSYSVGATATPLQVAATGNGTLTYQWQSSTDNTPFTDIPNATKDTYTPPTDKAGVSYYRCIVSSGTCTDTSDLATITVAADNTVYLRPTDLWNADNARFAVYYWDGNGTHWADMTRTSDCEEVYTASVPANYTSIIFCRMNPSTKENNWDNKWNQTSDLSVNDGKVYTIVEGAWSKGNGSWAIYTPSYLVSFNMNGHGDAVSDQCVQSGATITQPTAPTATGYIFAGWYADQACTQEWDFATTISAATTLYAKWNEDLTSPISIKGSWDSWKVHTLEKKAGETGDVAYYTVSLEAGTYSFVFYNGSVHYKIHSDGAQSMTRTNANGIEWYFYKDGDGMQDCNIVADCKGDYTFRVDYTSVNQDERYGVTVTYPALHTITYQEGRPDEYGSSLTTYGIPTSTTQVGNGGTLTLPDYTAIKIAAGSTTVYEFAGWSDGKTTYPANQTTIDNITSDLTLTAIWQPVTFHIYYWDGQNEDNSRNTAINGLTPTTYTYPSKDPLPTDAAAITDAAKKQGYVFKNWKVRDWSKTEFTLKDLDYTTPYHPYGDINLYAEWEEEVGCVVIFDATAKVETSGNCSTMTAAKGTVSVNSPSSNQDGAIKLNTSGYIELKPETGKKFLAGDQLHVTFKGTNKNKDMGFCIKKDDGKTITEERQKISVKANDLSTDTYTLQEDDINKDGSSIRIYRLSGDDRFYAIQVEQCQNVETVTATVKPGGGIIDEADATSLGYSQQVQSDGMIWYTITVAKGSHITLPTAAFAGYEFDCYQAEDASLTKRAAGEKFALTENQTFIAQWHTSSTGRVKATLNLNGGTFKNANEQAQWTKEPATTDSYYILINKGADLTLPEIVPPTGKTFVCFTDQDGEKYYPSIPFSISANYDFVAQWCSNPVTLTWNGLNQDGTFTIAPAVSGTQIPTLTTQGLPADAEIKYTSSDETVAIIRDNGTEIIPFMEGTTTITATYDGDGDYCPAEASYTLHVSCNDATPVIEADNLSLSCNQSITLRVKAKADDGTTTDYTAGNITFQWYKNSEPIDGATGSTYTVQTIGDYFVVVHDFCYAQSENTAHITSNESATPEVVRLSPFLFYRPGHTYPAEQTARHLFAYKSAGNDSKACRLSAVCKRNGTRTEIMDTDLTFLQTSDTPDAQGRYTITTSLNNIPASLGWQAGDTVIVTLTPYDNCDELSPAYADSIAIRIINRPALAFIISSADRPTRNRKNYKLHGDFLKINEADLCEQTKSDWNKWDDNVSHKELPLYTTIKEKFEVVPVNGYADFNMLNYEPFDIIVLTDFLRTTMGEGDKIAPVIDSLAQLVDYRPMLSLKSHMAKKEFPTWKEKGFTGNPEKPSSTQKDMTVLCLAHGIFEGLDAYQGTAPTEDDYANKIIYDSNDNIVVRITSKGGYDKKALQGFSAVDAANFVNIAIISDGGNGSLVTCCERQANINARMLVLSVNADATSLITPIGEQAIIRGLEYLLQTDPVKVSDCSVTFDNGGTEQRAGSGDHLWATAANWSSGRVPLKEQNVQIAENCIVNIQDATAATIKIVQGKTLTIQPTGALVANGKIYSISSSNDKYNAQPVSDPGMITILASETATGALIHTTEADEQLSATVQLYSKAYFEWVDGKRKKYWQYIGVPIQEAQVPQCFQGAYTWLWTESEGWTRKADGTSLEQFYGYGLSTGVTENERVTYTLQGSLATATNREIPLTINNAVDDYRGTNMIGNSWTAPICIDKMEDTDFGTAPATIYMYNTGRDPESGSVVGDNTTTTAGQWLSIPINLVKQSGYTGPKVIPAMQAFDVLTTSETSLYLDYNRLVRSGATANMNTPLYAPKRNTTNESGQVSMMKIMVADSRTHTNLYLLEDNAFSDRFDNGWEAEFMSNDGRSASLYAISPIGNMAVSAVADINGTTLGFEKGMENQYTFSFAYTGRMLYLNDIQQQRSTLITDWNTYTFTTSENDDVNRFYISSTPIDVQTPTGIANLTATDGGLRLSNPAHEDLQIGIYDAAGRLCALSHTAEAMTDIALPSTQGVYLIHINGENTRIVHKVTR